MVAFFDVHNHILPGIDDGPKNMEESLRMISMAYNEGIRIILATPHYYLGKSEKRTDYYLNLLDKLNDMITQIGMHMQLILGNELFFSVGIIEALKKGEALTIDGTRYILVEFASDLSFQEMWKGLNHCIFAGYIPILAHAERYRCLQKHPDLVGELVNLGAYMQVNISSICGRAVNPTVRFSRKLLKKEWVHFLGTDAHGADRRAPCIRKGAAYLTRKYGEERVRQLFWENPMTMLENKHL